MDPYKKTLVILHKSFMRTHDIKSRKKTRYIVMLNDSKITSSNEKEVLGILIDGKLNFENHLSYLCKKQVKNSFPTLRSRINGGGGRF